MKYPLPATAVVTVEPSATIPDCQAVPAEISAVAPKLIDVPFNVKLGLANLALAIEPDNISFVTDVLGKVTVFEDKSKVDVSLATVKVPSSISLATTVLGAILAVVTASSVIAFVTILVSAIVYLSLIN